MPGKRKPVSKTPTKKRGGSPAAAAVNRLVEPSGWRALNANQSGFPGLQGGAMSFDKLFKTKTKGLASSVVITHQSLRGGASVPPARAPSGPSTIRSGSVANGIVLNSTHNFSMPRYTSYFPTHIDQAPRNIDFRLQGGSKRTAPAKRKAASPIRLPSLKSLAKELDQIFGKRAKAPARKASQRKKTHSK